VCLLVKCRFVSSKVFVVHSLRHYLKEAQTHWVAFAKML
jgi:hypothetical protein